ncbi:hypothetical protein DINM_001395 [Dirofilaria immitis]|nr:hypothetical protein [Dirofilaria immitis]
MPVARIIISNDELSDGDILQLNSANFSLRVALIFLIVTVIIFIVIQLIKLISQIWAISNKAAKIDLSSDSETPEIAIHSTGKKSRKKSKRRKSKYSLPSKEMKIQLSLTNEEEKEITSDSEPQNEIQNTPEINVVPHGEIQKFSGELTAPDIKDSLTFSSNKSLLPITNLQNLPPTTPISTGEKPILPKIKAQDSLMIIDNQLPLKPTDNAEKRNPVAQTKEQEHTFCQQNFKIL